jgi:hypothetical protein
VEQMSDRDRARLRSDPFAEARKPTMFAACANPRCQSGWMHPWRSRSRPVLDGCWTCCPKCTEALLGNALTRELGEFKPARTTHRPRIPIGLLLVEQGWISTHQLRTALDAQKREGGGRVGSWLVKQNALCEERLARGLGLQWSCPFVELKDHDPISMASVMPRLLLDAYGALPVKLGGRRVLYLAFEESPDPSVALALERMTGVRVECGFITDSQFQTMHARLLKSEFPPVTLIEAASPGAAVRALTRAIERQQPVASRLVRVREFLWLRLWYRRPSGPIAEIGDVEDLICSIGPE